MQFFKRASFRSNVIVTWKDPSEKTTFPNRQVATSISPYLVAAIGSERRLNIRFFIGITASTR